MKRTPLAALLIVLIFGGLMGCSSDSSDTEPVQRVRTPATTQTGPNQTTAVEEPIPVPELTLETMDGDQIPLHDSPDQVLLLNFWATWCPPCREEIPDLVALQDEMGTSGLQIVGIALDQEGAEVVQPFLEEHDVNYPNVLDPDGTISNQFDQVYGLPTTIVIGPDGTIRHRVLGVFPVEQMKPKLQTLLDQAASG